MMVNINDVVNHADAGLVSGSAERCPHLLFGMLFTD